MDLIGQLAFLAVLFTALAFLVNEDVWMLVSSVIMIVIALIVANTGDLESGGYILLLATLAFMGTEVIKERRTELATLGLKNQL